MRRREQPAIESPAPAHIGSAFNQRATPEVPSHVIRVGADLSQDSTSGENFYLVRVRVDAQAMTKLGELKLVPGMPVEVFIQTGERSALSYVVKPLTDQFARAFREERPAAKPARSLPP
ncbi:MAG: hypothetical protein AAGC70_21040 [Pseudomonadota bacterium]